MVYRVLRKIMCTLHIQCILLESNKYRMAEFNEQEDNEC